MEEIRLGSIGHMENVEERKAHGLLHPFFDGRKRRDFRNGRKKGKKIEQMEKAIE